MTTQSVYHGQSDVELTEEALAAAGEIERQTHLLCDLLYAKIEKYRPDIPRREMHNNIITGAMLHDMENSELLALLKPESEAKLHRLLSDVMHSCSLLSDASSQS